MSEKYRATDKDWELVEGWAPDDTDVRCLLELRSRVELLEATQHAHLDASQLSEADREAMTEPGRVVTDQPEPAPLATDQDLYQLYDQTGPTVVDAFRAIYYLGRQHGAAQPAPAVKDSLTDAPAGSLVERLPEPSDELLEFWRQRAMAEYRDSCYEVPVSRSMALQAIAWCRQQLQPGAVEASQ
jgi:hypothetical protein